MIDFTQYLYDSLPPVYRLEDTHNDFTLKKYLDVLGYYLNYVTGETNDIKKLYDVEKMPKQYLKFFAGLFDFNLYDDVTEDFQRKLLANIVPILKRKGTREVIEFVAREITGCDVLITEGNSTIFATWQNPEDMAIGFINPVTYAEGQPIPYKYAGSELTNRFTMYVSILTDLISGITKEELAEKETVLKNYLYELIPTYIKLIFLVTQREEFEDVFEESVILTSTDELTGDNVLHFERSFGNVTYEDIMKIIESPNVYAVKLGISESTSDTQMKLLDANEVALMNIKEEHVKDYSKQIGTQNEELLGEVVYSYLDNIAYPSIEESTKVIGSEEYLDIFLPINYEEILTITTTYEYTDTEQQVGV